MSQYRHTMLLLPSLLMTVLLTGCFNAGSDNHQVKYPGNDDGSPGITPSLSSIKLNFFETDDDYQYLTRNMVTIRTGDVVETSMTLYGKKPADDAPDGVLQYYLGDKFLSSFNEDKPPSKWYKTDGVKKVFINWQDNNYDTPRANRQTIEYIAIDLDGSAGVNAAAPVGIHTLLNELPNTRTQNFTFPKGSRCYVAKHSTEKDYFDFDSSDVTDYQTLEQWKTAQDVQTGYTYQFVPKKVGTTNELDAVYLVRPEQINDHQTANGMSHSYEAAVVYNNKVYEATYYSKGDSTPDTDPKSSLVQCEAYNNVAADFISTQIKQYYR